MPKLVFLWTDLLLLAELACGVAYAWHVRRSPTLRATWRRVFRDPAASASAVLLGLFLGVAGLDSLHFRPRLAGAEAIYDTRTMSLLDVLLRRQIETRETSYSFPLAYRGFLKESREIDGKTERVWPRLDHAGRHLRNPEQEWVPDVMRRGLLGLAGGCCVAMSIGGMAVAGWARRHGSTLGGAMQAILEDRTDLPVRAALGTFGVFCLVAGPAVGWAWGGGYHVLGTDRTGNDVLYQALKSLRTAFVIGTLSTIATLPFAVVFGVVAGYFKGWIDEAVQYLYTTLSSVPNVLLIAACVLMIQVYIDKHPELFETGAERSDLRILLLCVVLGVTGWASLCRLLRAETLKLRELEYVQAATAFGVGPVRIMWRHILPNVMHLVLITTVLEFSALVLYEAVLSYVGVGVDPSMNSFGGMINLARTEMSRNPVVWWSFAAAFVFMVALMLAANLFADAVRDAFDPRARVFRRALVPPARTSGAEGKEGHAAVG